MKSYAICGLSCRAIAEFLIPLTGIEKLPEYGDFSKYGRIAALLDIDVKRCNEFNQRAGTSYPVYTPDEFDRMLEETRPDYVAVTGPDFTHAGYIVKALQKNIDVISEKPVIASCEQANEVFAAAQESKAAIRVTHNLRYTVLHKTLKRLLKNQEIGQITNIEMVYNLDSYHGSSYFRRWNRDRKLSGGLTITKGCHHFDLLNWLVDDVPEEVFAFGALNYYGPGGFHSPRKKNGKNLSVEEQKKLCPYYKRWNSPGRETPKDDHLNHFNKLFKIPMETQYPPDQELYIYDDDIHIEDTYSSVLRYRNGVSAVYSSNFSAPWEGYILGINGSLGRIEVRHYGAPSRCNFHVDTEQKIFIHPLFGESRAIDIKTVEGGHGGADICLKHEMFVEQNAESKELDLAASFRDGALAVGVGEAVWRSAVEKRPVKLSELLCPGLLNNP
jgi:predicted dehydrogenase